jgi:hypothetical protein
MYGTVFEITPPQANFELPYIFTYRSKLLRQMGNTERFQSFKKAEAVHRISKDQNILNIVKLTTLGQNYILEAKTLKSYIHN